MTASSAQATTAILLERAQRRSFDSSQAAARFNLSQRERETVELLVHGYTSKEIASRMQISPDTVKTFVRLIMVKMGVSTRSGLVGKILTARLELSDQFS
jgi:DNA-binding NarL/FixJ family response regulator